MRLRERQRIYRRFFAGESVGELYRAMRKDYTDIWRESEYRETIESIIREGHAKGWDTGKRVAK